MKEAKIQIFIIGLTFLIVSLSTTGYSGSLYRCVNSQGSVMLTDNVSTDPDFKCIFAASYRDLTPKEREKEQREVEALRQKARADLEREKSANKANKAQDAANRREEGNIAVGRAVRDAKIEFLEKAIKNPGGDLIRNVRDANEKIDRVRDQYR